MERNIPSFNPKVILAIAAHPDDLEFGTSGSVAKWVNEGANVHYVVCTDGSKGSEDRHISTSDLIALRRDEQKAAAKILGVKTVTFFDYEDGVATASYELKRDIVREIRRIKPDTVIAQDPSMLYLADWGMVNHNDHRQVGLAVMDAVYPLARDHLSFPELLSEGFEPHKVGELLFMAFENHNYFVDITDTFEKKIAALAAHKSQVDIDQVRGWLDEASRRTGSRSGYKRAEGFIRLHMRI